MDELSTVVRDIELKVKELQVCHNIDLNLMQHIAGGSPCDVWVKMMEDEVAFRFSKAFACQRTHSISVSYPKTWWDYVKRDLLPKWFERRFPAQYESVTLEGEAVAAAMEIPDKYQPIIRLEKVEKGLPTWLK
jgi:hypothetical protein